MSTRHRIANWLVSNQNVVSSQRVLTQLRVYNLFFTGWKGSTDWIPAALSDFATVATAAKVDEDRFRKKAYTRPIDAESIAWFDNFVRHNIDDYLPSLYIAIQSRQLPSNKPLPKFCQLPVKYHDWYDKHKLNTEHPGVLALKENRDIVQKELGSLSGASHCYTTATSSPNNGERDNNIDVNTNCSRTNNQNNCDNNGTTSSTNRNDNTSTSTGTSNNENNNNNNTNNDTPNTSNSDNTDDRDGNKWMVTAFERFGRKNHDIISRCPVTWACLQHFGLEYGWGEVLVSTLQPYTALPIHTGESGFNLICHFGINVPKGDLAMVVNNTTETWKTNEAILFDDSFPHYAYNNTPSERTVLLIEHWNPQVPHDVRPLLSRFVTMWARLVPPHVFDLNTIDNRFNLEHSSTHLAKINTIIAKSE